MTEVAFRERETRSLCEWIESTLTAEKDRFTAAKTITRRLGGQWHDDHATVAIWTPEVTDLSPEAVTLEVFTPTESVDPGDTERRSVDFRRDQIETRRVDEFTVAAVEGARRGTRDQLGSLYQLRVEGHEEPIRDPLADSVPFGAFAPAELYDTDRLDETRADREYFQRLETDGEPPHRDRAESATEPGDVPRFAPATNLLEVHPGTATERETLAGLTETFEEIGRKQRADESLTTGETVFAGYDGVQLMPLAPVTENPEAADHWQPESVDSTGEVSVEVRRPDSINWGYDVVISGFGAVNPSILETGRPDELVELISTLHTLPEPKRVVFDIALGHAEGRATELLPDQYFSGPGMYGMELDYTQPVVRATLLEMQRRKLNFGADGIRVDGAQDFTNWDPERGEWHDDEFLAEMNDLVQEVAGVEYRPWLIYEDGRPWPRQDWELASTYRELIEQHPHSYQWGPVTFAHNTPALLTFWASKWWRVAELRDHGAHWISGVANHDTLRRGSQLPVPDGWEGDPINPYLGDTPRETYREAYDNPATSLLMYGFLPGVPMDFVHANAHAPWAFVRDTEADWHVKVAAEEHEFVTWHVREEDFADERFFERLGNLGIDSRGELQSVAASLADAVEATAGEEPDWSDTAAVLTAMDTPLGEVSAEDIDAYATAWMEDVHEFCNLSHWLGELDDERARFGRAVREFRQSRPWIRENLAEADTFDYRHPTDGTVVYFGHRTGPDGEELLFCANVEGVETTVTPAELVSETEAEAEAGAEAGADGWSVALAAPSLVAAEASVTEPDAVRGAEATVTSPTVPITLANGEAVVFSRQS